MAGVIFRNISGNLQGQTITCEIIDKDAGGDDPVDFKIAMPGWSITMEGDKNNAFHNIYTRYAKCNMVLSGEDHRAWFDSMINNTEGRYFAKISIAYGDSFVGKIIMEDMRLEDDWEPVYSFSAIDGLTDLKGIDYVHYYPNRIVEDEVSNIFKTIFNLLPTKDFLQSVVAIGFQSDIVPDVDAYDGNLLACQYVTPYFYKVENSKRVPMTAWEVLDEICKRMHVSIKNSLNIWWITGLEGIHNERLTDLHYYDKDMTFYVTSGISDHTDDISDNLYALSGGEYSYSSGYKRVTIESDKIFSNRQFGDGIFWNLRYNLILTSDYQTMGIAKANTKYKVRININVLNNPKINNELILQPYFWIKMNMGVVSGAMIATDKIYNMVTVPGKYYFEYIIDEDSADRTIQAKFEIEDNIENLQSMAVDISCTMTELTQIYDTIKVISTIDGSKNPKTKTIKTYGNHHNGTEAVRWSYRVGSGDFETTKNYKFSGGATKGYEQLLAENILLYSGNTETLEIGINRVLYPAPFQTYTYRGRNYFLSGYTMYPHDGRTDIIVIKINDAQDGTIITEQEVPLQDDINEPTSSIIGNIILYVNKYQEEFPDVTEQYVVPEEDMSVYFTDITDIKRDWEIYVNGVKQQYVDVAVVSYPPDPGELNMMQYTYFAATNRIYFGLPMDSSYVEIKYSKT